MVEKEKSPSLLPRDEDLDLRGTTLIAADSGPSARAYQPADQ